MGDINLLGMIRKIKNSLSGFVSTSDKASKSAFGIVKVGDNISVSSGKISVPVATEDTYGVVKAGGSGFTVDEIWTGNVTSDYKNITSELVHPITEYKFLVVSRSDGYNVQPGQLLYVPNMASGTNNSNYLYYGSNNINIRLGDGSVSIGGTVVTNIKLLGIK